MNVLILIAGLFGAALALAAPLPAWQATDGLDDPHLGQVWDTHAQRWLEPQQLVDALLDEPRVILGERHDHPDHHRLQLWLLEQLQAQP